MKPSKKTFAKLKEEIYKNAFRLFCDSCFLFHKESFPSSFALSILSLEELGKLEMVDHICGEIPHMSESRAAEHIQHLFSRGMYFSHKNKQIWASMDDLSTDKKRLKNIGDGNLDKEKQKAFYVGFDKRIQSPLKISSQKAYSELKITFQKFISIRDLGFNGFDCWTTQESEEEVNKYIKKLETNFQGLKKP